MSEVMDLRTIRKFVQRPSTTGGPDYLAALGRQVLAIEAEMRSDRLNERVEVLEGGRRVMEEVVEHRREIADLGQQTADLRETLGGVEAQVHELRNAPGVRNSVSDLAAAGWPGLVARAEQAERQLVEVQRKLVEAQDTLREIATREQEHLRWVAGRVGGQVR